jgi:hypothetical protein
MTRAVQIAPYGAPLKNLISGSENDMMITVKKAAALLGVFILCVSASYAQQENNIPGYLVQQLQQYTQKIPREEIYVHSDRDEYIAGEDMWFTLYLFDRQSLQLSNRSRIAYVELLNAENRPVLQKKFMLDQGCGPGQFVLPDTLSTGTYTLRAYTSWMKNFLPYNCFMKPIIVYNAFTTKALYKASGAGNFTAKEAVGINGLTVAINSTLQDTLEILVKNDNSSLVSSGMVIYLVIQTRGNINQVSKERIQGVTTRITVPKSKLSQGINQIALFNAKGEPVAEKYSFTPLQAENLYTLQVTDSCHTREEITLKALPGEAYAAGNATHLSVSVAPVSPGSEKTDMADYLILGSEYGNSYREILKGRKFSEIAQETLDSLLAQLQSNWINWSVILGGEMPEIKYPAEKEDHFLWGKLQINNQPPDEGAIVMLCFPGKDAGFQYSRTDREGNFRFAVPIDDGLRDLIVMPERISDNQKITLASSFSDLYDQQGTDVQPVRQPILSYISKWSLNHQVQAIYGTAVHGNHTDPSSPVPSIKRFYGKPDIELRMSDYISLPLMEEVFFELLPNVSLKKKNAGYEITITDRVDNKLYVTNPCLMIDGVIINDASLIINLDPEIVEKIDVIKGQYLVGSYSFPGLVNVITKSADFTCVSLPGYMYRFSYRVLDPLPVFVSPEYSSELTKGSRIPDYRNTLYWNPSVKAEPNGSTGISCWSGDNKGTYLVTLQGITRENRVIALRKFIQVK